ncbi:hypothetical protein LBMAG48_27610 [Phycisphaerae bacterium]|nr:hypothetical protein LBMAG48_27610 [Phycisphaerae bacterium]
MSKQVGLKAVIAFGLSLAAAGASIGNCQKCHPDDATLCDTTAAPCPSNEVCSGDSGTFPSTHPTHPGQRWVKAKCVRKTQMTPGGGGGGPEA